MLTHTIVREEFPALGHYNFLDSANQSLLPFSSLQRATEILDKFAFVSLSDAQDLRSELVATCDRCRREVATLINSTASEIALVENTTFGMNLSIHLIDQLVGLNKGDNVIIPDMDFLGIPASLHGKTRTGVRIKWAKNVDGRFTTESLLKCIDKRTKAVILSSVQESNGFRANLVEMRQVLHEKNILLAIDAVQHVGALGFDAKMLDVDFAFAGGHKWLNAPLGTGIFYCNKKHLDYVNPLIYGYRNLKIRGGLRTYIRRPKRLPLLQPRFVKNARKLEIGGTPNLLGIACLLNSVDQKNSFGIANIERKIHGLCNELIDELQHINARIESHILQEKERSGIVTFRLNRSIEKDRELVMRLVKRKNLISFRMNLSVGGIRVSPHFFNESSDIQDFVKALREA